ncbi:MAG TPA: ATP-dependent DNA helicase RecG [Candidatus Paceibacterota bacterium]|nr:ATP-dependent DNA helicase RecG [Candidatus Paceibacterota bacterium]
MKPTDFIGEHFKFLKPEQKKALTRLGVRTIRDLLYHFPARYESSEGVRTIGDLVVGETATLYGHLKGAKAKKTWKTKMPSAEAYLEDGSGRVKVMWFRQPYMAKMTEKMGLVKITGKVAGTPEKPYITNPAVEKAESVPAISHESLFGGDEPVMFAVYPETKGISSLWFRHAIERTMRSLVQDEIDDIIPESLRAEYSLPKVATALVWMHAPKKASDAAAARKRFAFEEVFSIQLAVQKARAESAHKVAPALTVDRSVVADFIKDFPFTPTKAQQDAIASILEDFEKPHPMMRLLEGDVGSGKTAVAAAVAYAVAHARDKGSASRHLQVAYMVPTEILAKQHFASFIEFFKKHHLSIGLITGKECYKFPSKVRGEMATRISKAQLSKWVANGEIPLVIGTHALIQKGVQFRDLAFAIIDEQHRFGKVQRKSLARKDGKEPHLLSMTATPIPRTLALTVYGDLDLTVLDQMPLGRKPVITEVVTEATRKKAYARIHEELAAGRQAYVICPRIDEPDPAKEFALQAKSAKSEQERLQNSEFTQYRVGLLHSKMTPAEKEEEMRKFVRNESQVLVATSVVEVGVNVPNATVILIEGAERFGLAQLHQLRGRVIRSNDQAYCFLLSESKGDVTVARLKALTTAKNGFELAEADLALRGTGELYGPRQWGVSDIAMEALTNLKMVEAARSAARHIIEQDPTLTEHPLLAKRITLLSENLYGE